MLKKLLVGAVAAGVLSVPFAGVAWAGGNGVGKGGIPADPGSAPPGSTTGAPPGVTFSQTAKLPGNQSAGIASLNGIGGPPGSYVKDLTPGCSNGGGPNPVGCH
jgi:hypothetical protein